MTDHIRTLSEMAAMPISCFPNAGLPNEDNQYLETPESLSIQLGKFYQPGLAEYRRRMLRYETDSHSRHRSNGRGQASRPIPGSSHRVLLLRIELVEAEDGQRPLIVGERTNVIGSRLFKKLLAEEKWEEATEIARWQVKNGAHIIDVCLQSSDRDELATSTRSIPS
jgi:5-methyltetrahydrofolate--homocysteine methyltransferase